MIFESHAHYDDEQFDEDRKELLESMNENGIEKIVNIGADIKTSQNTVLLTDAYPFIYGAIGVHPNEVGKMTEEDIEWLRQMSRKEKIVAIGEIGLDYYYPEPSRQLQKHWFLRQMELAEEERLPVVIHSREAAQDTVDMMKASHAERIGGVVHCFSYTKEMAKKFLDMGFYIGIGGVVTFQNAKKIKEAVSYIPLDRILLETDSPYLAPAPNRGKRNSSLNLPYIAEEIARLKDMDYEEIVKETNENAKKLFGLKGK